MKYHIEIDARALKTLRGLPLKARRQIVRRIEALADDPHPNGARRIEGQLGIWRIRAGAYRIAYIVQEEVVKVLVIRIGDRKDFYKYFARKELRFD